MIKKERVAIFSGIVATVVGVLLVLLEPPNSTVILIGVIVGAIYGVPIGLYIETKRRQWLAIFALMLFLPAAALMIHWSAPVFLVATVAATVYMNSYILSPLFNENIAEAFVHLVKLITGMWRGIQVVESGKTIVPSDGRRVLGPTLLIIRPNNAVVLEGGKKPRVVFGQAFLVTERFEYVKGVYDLRPKQERYSISDCLTSDGIAIRLRIVTIAGIKIRLSTRQDGATQAPAEEAYIQRIYWYLEEWNSRLEAAINTAARIVIARYDLEHLIVATPYDRIALEIKEHVNQHLLKWGMKMYDLSVESVTPPAELLKQNAEATAEQVRAQAWKEALLLIADGYNIARGMNMPEAVIDREVLRRTLEQMASEPGVGALISPAFSSILRELFESLRK